MNSNYEQNVGVPGFVYVLSNSSFDGNVVKIGCTRRSARVRAQELTELGSTALPFGFRVIYERESNDCGRAEQLVFQLLSHFRLGEWGARSDGTTWGKEFFRLEKIELAIAAIDAACEKYSLAEDTLSFPDWFLLAGGKEYEAEVKGFIANIKYAALNGTLQKTRKGGIDFDDIDFTIGSPFERKLESLRVKQESDPLSLIASIEKSLKKLGARFAVSSEDWSELGCFISDEQDCSLRPQYDALTLQLSETEQFCVFHRIALDFLLENDE